MDRYELTSDATEPLLAAARRLSAVQRAFKQVEACQTTGTLQFFAVVPRERGKTHEEIVEGNVATLARAFAGAFDLGVTVGVNEEGQELRPFGTPLIKRVLPGEASARPSDLLRQIDLPDDLAEWAATPEVQRWIPAPGPRHWPAHFMIDTSRGQWCVSTPISYNISNGTTKNLNGKAFSMFEGDWTLIRAQVQCGFDWSSERTGSAAAQWI